MKKLTDIILKDILARRKYVEEWQRDCSNLLAQGVSLRQIGLVIDTANQLDVAPWLTDYRASTSLTDPASISLAG